MASDPDGQIRCGQWGISAPQAASVRVESDRLVVHLPYAQKDGGEVTLQTAGHFFGQLGFWRLLDAGRRWPRLLPDEDPDDDWASCVLVLIANRLTRRCSEHALAGWLETDYVCDRFGRRYVPFWKKRGRIQVDPSVA